MRRVRLWPSLHVVYIHSALFRLSFRERCSIDYKKIRKKDLVNVSAGCGQTRILFTATFEGGPGCGQQTIKRHSLLKFL